MLVFLRHLTVPAPHYLQVCNYPVDAKEFCTKIRTLELNIPAEYECS